MSRPRLVKPDRAAYEKAYYAKKRQDPEWVAREKCRQKAWRAKAKPYLKDRMLRWKFGLPPGQYDVLLKGQEGRCAICRSLPDGKRLAVDHCHQTGTVRGLLCDTCNRGIGHFKDDPEMLRQAIKYLEEGSHGKENG